MNAFPMYYTNGGFAIEKNYLRGGSAEESAAN
jgi:hypothetical protein